VLFPDRARDPFLLSSIRGCAAGKEDWFMESLQIHPAMRDELLAHPKIRQKILSLNIITIAFFVAAGVYFFLLYFAVVGTAEPMDERWTWFILLVASFALVPNMFILGAILMGQVKIAPNHESAFARAQLLILLELAHGELVVIFGLIGSFLGMPVAYQYALMVLGVALMAMALLLFRNQAIDIVLMKLMEEEKQD
jgi:hypothetical protein